MNVFLDCLIQICFFAVTQALFDEMVKEMKAQVEVFWIEGGGHGLTVKGKSEDSLLEEVNSQVLTWIKKQT